MLFKYGGLVEPIDATVAVMVALEASEPDDDFPTVRAVCVAGKGTAVDVADLDRVNDQAVTAVDQSAVACPRSSESDRRNGVAIGRGGHEGSEDDATIARSS